MSLPSLRTAIRNLFAACVVCALSLDVAFAGSVREKIAHCGSTDSILPPDFIEAREDLIRSVKARDWSYYDRLLAPGIFMPREFLRDPLVPVESKLSPTGHAVYQQTILEPLSDCARYRTKVICNALSAYDDPDMDETDTRVIRTEGVYGRASPDLDAPRTTYVPCGTQMSGRRHEVISRDGKQWIHMNFHSIPAAYYDLNDLKVVRDFLLGSWVVFERIGGRWRITGVGRARL